MKIFSHFKEAVLRVSSQQVVTIGNFDGIHVGHKTLLLAARGEADRLGLPAAVLTFEPRPIAVLDPKGAPPDLLTPQTKRALFHRLGMDAALFQRFDDEFAKMSAESFAEDVLVSALKAKVVVIGQNFRFGKDRSAAIPEMTGLGHRLGFEVLTIPLAEVDGEIVSSSWIRTLLSVGNVKKAAELLSRRYELSGLIAKDRGVGRTLGFPTVNIENIQVMVPKSGIYAARLEVGGILLKAAVYIGERPTLDAGFAVEAHILDFEGDLYNRKATIHFVDWIREDRKFDTTSDLVCQISDDIGRIRSLLEESE
jgi:riboflavin kinase/FMN adenylyltransferase